MARSRLRRFAAALAAALLLAAACEGGGAAAEPTDVSSSDGGVSDLHGADTGGGRDLVGPRDTAPPADAAFPADTPSNGDARPPVDLGPRPDARDAAAPPTDAPSPGDAPPSADAPADSAPPADAPWLVDAADAGDPADAPVPPADVPAPPADVPAPPPDVPPPPPPCEGPHPCAPAWGLPSGIVATSCVPSGALERCTYALVDGAEPLVGLQATYLGAIVYRRRTDRLTADGAPDGCTLPPRAALTPAPLSCCRADEPVPVCGAAPAAWDTPTWAALGVAFAEEHGWSYAFDHEPDRLVVRAERLARCGAGVDCRHRVTVAGLLDGGCGALAPFTAEHAVAGTCPAEAGRRLGAIDLSAAQAAAFRPPAGVTSLHPDRAEVDAALAALVTAAAAFHAGQPAGACRFPADAGPAPAIGTCCAALGGSDTDGDGRCDGPPAVDFAADGWLEAGGFAPAAPAFVYELTTTLQAPDGPPLFAASAYGDLDCDGVQSTFRRFARPGPADTGCAAAAVSGTFVERENE
jgi:hypothetical protein